METTRGLRILSNEFQNDSDRAWSFHCNLVTNAVDAGADIKAANRIMATFMVAMFGVQVDSFPQYKLLMEELAMYYLEEVVDGLTERDLKVVEHVANISKNIHAALIVKQLITGWDVEIQDNITRKWNLIVKPAKPSWSEEFTYRLVKPKMKPAYRAFKFGDGSGTSTVDRNENGNFSSPLPIGAKWLGDWIEYDHP